MVSINKLRALDCPSEASMSSASTNPICGIDEFMNEYQMDVQYFDFMTSAATPGKSKCRKTRQKHREYLEILKQMMVHWMGLILVMLLCAARHCLRSEECVFYYVKHWIELVGVRAKRARAERVTARSTWLYYIKYV
eukprot:566683_1